MTTERHDDTPDTTHADGSSDPTRYGTRWGDEGEWGFVPGPDGYYPPHREKCFGCGPENATGLQIRLRDADESGVIACEYRFPERFQGGPGVVHGGAIAAVLDDVVGTVPLSLGTPRVTGKLSVNYRRPVIVGHEVSIRAWQETVEGRKAIVKGEMRDSLGRLLADAEALMVEMPTEGYSKFAAELPPEEIPDDFKPFLPDENYP